MTNSELKQKSKARIIELLIEGRKKLYDDLVKIKNELEEVDNIIKDVLKDTKNAKQRRS